MNPAKPTKQSFPKPIDTRNIISESKESILRYGTVNPLAPKPETEDRTTQAMGQFYLLDFESNDEWDAWTGELYEQIEVDYGYRLEFRKYIFPIN